MRLLQNVFRLDDALKLGIEHILPAKRVVEKHLSDCLGAVLAQDIFATAALPHFDRSTMDGFAVRAIDTHGASEAIPAMLQQGESCHPILTGGPLPVSCDAVVMIEYIEELHDGTVLVQRPVAVGENVLAAGEDVAEGVKVAERGEILTPRKLAVLAAFGHSRIDSCGFRVLILSSGNEIVPVEETPGLGQVRDINAHYVQAMCRQMGLTAVYGGIVPDDEAMLLEVMSDGLAGFDAVIISGGSSAGALDYSSRVVDRLGSPGVLVHGLAIKPGKPTIIGSCAGKLVLCLPGHPLSCALTAHHVARPLLAYAAGVSLRQPRIIGGKLGRALSSVAGRRDHIPVRYENGVAIPLLSKSAAISALAHSDGVLTIPEECEGLSGGAAVQIELWED